MNEKVKIFFISFFTGVVSVILFLLGRSSKRTGTDSVDRGFQNCNASISTIEEGIDREKSDIDRQREFVKRERELIERERKLSEESRGICEAADEAIARNAEILSRFKNK